MSARTRAGVALTVAAMAIATAPASAASRSKCRAASTSHGAKVVKRTSSAVVFTRRGVVYGCLYSGGPVARLLDEGGGIHLGKQGDVGPKLAGRYVAYATLGSAIGDEFDRVVVWDLKAGKVRFEASSNVVSALVLKGNGSVAWVQGSVVSPADSSRPVYEVRELSAVDRAGALLLDRGPDIDRRSLAVSGDTVSWTRGGVARSAPLR